MHMDWTKKSSDLDIRGIALNSKKEILLSNDFEQVVDENTDTKTLVAYVQVFARRY